MKRLILMVVVFLCNHGVQAQAVSQKQGLLADVSGRTLYIFDKDAPGKSNCNGSCTATWPPFVAKLSAAEKADYSVVARDDGSSQWAYKGQPLYYFAGDAKPGESNGDGMGGTWHAIREGARSSKPAPLPSGVYNENSY